VGLDAGGEGGRAVRWDALVGSHGRLGSRSLAELRALPAERLLEATQGRPPHDFPGTIDGYFLPRSPVELFTAGEQAHVPLLVGWNSEEASYAFLLQGQEPTLENYYSVVRERFGARAEQVLRLYPATTDAEVVAVATDLASDMFLGYTTWKWADVHSRTGGRPVYPGFIDAHAHFAGYGQSLFAVDLFGSASFEEVVERVQKFAAGHPGLTWITGRGWDQNKFPGKAFPDNTRLNALFANVPVMLQRVDGHAAIANAKALELAGVKPGRQLTGGTVETKNGRLTGILIDNAQRLVWQQIPPLSSADYTERLLAAEKNCFAQGLTTVTDCGLSRREIEGIDSLQRAGKLHMRIYVMLSDTRENLEHYLPKGPYKTDLLYVKGVKAYADGALGSRGACLLQPYDDVGKTGFLKNVTRFPKKSDDGPTANEPTVRSDDKPGWYGFLLNDPAHYDSLARALAGTDFQLCTHAIGDSANRLILTVYNKYLSGKNDKRWRIEHAQVINEKDFDLFGKASVIPSVQPTHATSDMYWAGERVGARRLKGRPAGNPEA